VLIPRDEVARGQPLAASKQACISLKLRESPVMPMDMRFMTYPIASSRSGSAQPAEPPMPKCPNARGPPIPLAAMIPRFEAILRELQEVKP